MIINFQFDTEYGRFSDAIHLEDNHTLSENDIEEIKQQRLTNFINVIKASEEVDG